MTSYNCEDIYRYYKKAGGTLAYNVFKRIISENNKAISSLVINNGYEYEIPHKIGLLKIVKNKRKITITENNTIKGAVNWGESNKLKASLLEEGKLLYECVKDKEGKIISDNGGEKWLVYHTDNFYYRWIKISGVFLHNALKYDFTPTWTNARALIASITEYSDILYKSNKDDNKKHGTNRDYLFKILTAKSGDNVRDKQQ